MLIVHFLLCFPMLILHFLLISQLGHPVVQKENGKFILKSYYFKILLERAFLKGGKMAADLCKSRSYSIVFQKMTQDLEFMCESRYGTLCGAQGINLTLKVPTTDNSTGELCIYDLIKNSSLPSHCDINSYFTPIFSKLFDWPSQSFHSV